MFYDLFCELCKQKNVAPTRAALDMGISKATPTTWKNKGITPQAAQLQKIADYFGVSVDYLLGNEPKEKTPAVTIYDEHDHVIHLDDDTMAMLESLRTRPDMKMLFSVSSKATPEDILKTVRIIEALRDESKGK